MQQLADLVETVVRPVLLLLDRSGLFQTLRFSPVYKLVASLSAVVLSSYVLALLTRPVDRGVKAARKFRILGRVVTVILAALITREIFSSTAFILDRAGSSSDILRSNLGFLMVLALVLFLEIRLLRMR